MTPSMSMKIMVTEFHDMDRHFWTAHQVPSSGSRTANRNTAAVRSAHFVGGWGDNRSDSVPFYTRRIQCIGSQESIHQEKSHSMPFEKVNSRGFKPLRR
ncbi:hypothetical protein IV203_023709 [Nitzschia inconspicua]|uniref:Uncharacterized protein n=1 Tax=Nitzschia inconspicua TaxID=303405 RepID=A0A9K3PCL0_9STRA|nr:hypothetical protein IV203_023709 [Nitzschia inconspicua]